ncbi:unnamed protein product, partial [Polarella glacialis]
DWTPQLQDFSEEVRLLREQALHRPPQQLEVKTFFDLQAYNLDPYAGKLRKEPGSMQLMYMFYSREAGASLKFAQHSVAYTMFATVGKQKGVEVPLFAPVNFGDRSLGFRAILDWARDFRVSPARVTRKELERIFVTVHGGSMPALEKFTSKITYTEFVTFVVLCGTAGEPMDRSKVDGSRVREIETRLEQVKRLSTCLFLANSKKVKLGLHDAWRDVHFWKLSDGADFEKEARACEMRSRPQHRVDAIDIPEGCQDTAAARRYLDQFTWSQKDHLWEEFEAPCLDMGAFVLAGAVKKFRVSITNRGFSLCRLKLDVSSVGPVRLPWRDGTLGPGQSAEVMIEVVPMECGEWRGDIVASASWTGGFASPAEEIRIPTYVKVLQPQKGGSDAIASRLPLHAPRPFRPGSVCRISVDPACSHNQQLRAPTPHGRGSRPGSAVALSSSGGAKPPRPSSCGALLPQRAGSAGGSTAVPSRPLSVLASSRCCSSAAAGPPSSLGQVGKYCGLVPPTSPTPTPMRNFGDKAFDGYAMDVRPRNAMEANTICNFNSCVRFAEPPASLAALKNSCLPGDVADAIGVDGRGVLGLSSAAPSSSDAQHEQMVAALAGDAGIRVSSTSSGHRTWIRMGACVPSPRALNVHVAAPISVRSADGLGLALGELAYIREAEHLGGVVFSTLFASTLATNEGEELLRGSRKFAILPMKTMPGDHGEELVADLEAVPWDASRSDEEVGAPGTGRGMIVVQTNATSSFHVSFSHDSAVPTRGTDVPSLRFVVGKRRNSMTTVGLGNPYIKKEPIDFTRQHDALLTESSEKSRTFWFLYDKNVGVAAMGVQATPQADLCRLVCRFRDAVGFRAEVCEQLRYVSVSSGKRPVSLRIVYVGAPPDISIPRFLFDPISWQELPWRGCSCILELDKFHTELVQRVQDLVAASPIAPFYGLVEPGHFCLNAVRLLEPLRRAELAELYSSRGETFDEDNVDWSSCCKEVHRRLVPLLYSSAWTYLPLRFERADCTSITLAPAGPGCARALAAWLRAAEEATGIRNMAMGKEVLTLNFAFEVFPVEGENAAQVRRDMVRQVTSLLEKEWGVMEFTAPKLACWQTRTSYVPLEAATALKEGAS